MRPGTRILVVTLGIVDSGLGLGVLWAKAQTGRFFWPPWRHNGQYAPCGRHFTSSQPAGGGILTHYRKVRRESTQCRFPGVLRGYLLIFSRVQRVASEVHLRGIRGNQAPKKRLDFRKPAPEVPAGRVGVPRKKSIADIRDNLHGAAEVQIIVLIIATIYFASEVTITALIVCIRFSASSKTMLAGDSKTS